MRDQIEHNFTYHPPKESDKEKFLDIRNLAKAYALKLIAVCPTSRELEMAISNLENVVFWANASIARAKKP